MKKLIFLFALVIGFATFTHAQTATLMPLIAGDTVVDAGTVNKQFSSTAGYSAVGVQIVITKISGTVAGTTKLQGSLDGSNWEDIGSAFTHTNVASQAKLFTVSGAPYVYIRTTSVGTGTMAAQVRVRYVQKKYNQ